jgi:predicted glycoside hydrolase/deacetylase ChbG (UPF0249 family)
MVWEIGNRGRYLIVNADDFGYYDCVSKGILSAAAIGAVTATGIFANSPFLEAHLDWLKQNKSIDSGVHLNLTNRSPLTSAMRKKLHKWGGCFPGKFIMARSILLGRISLDLVAHELREQIEQCRAAGLELSFLNSHEHIHMIPPVFRITQNLALEYRIPHVRYAVPDALSSFKPGSFIRDIGLNFLGKNNRKLLRFPVLPFLGMSASGKLSLAYLRRILPKLPPGVHELMCHPGACGNEEVVDPALRAYHEWENELDVLTSNEFRNLCREENISLIGYRDVKFENGQPNVRIDTQ